MTGIELKVARIGNSRGVRIPAPTLDRYGIGDAVIMEERSDGILLRPAGVATSLLSWDETSRAMADAQEDWTDLDASDADGLDAVPWTTERQPQVAEPRAGYAAKRRKRK